MKHVHFVASVKAAVRLTEGDDWCLFSALWESGAIMLNQLINLI